MVGSPVYTYICFQVHGKSTDCIRKLDYICSRKALELILKKKIHTYVYIYIYIYASFSFHLCVYLFLPWKQIPYWNSHQMWRDWKVAKIYLTGLKLARNLRWIANSPPEKLCTNFGQIWQRTFASRRQKNVSRKSKWRIINLCLSWLKASFVCLSTWQSDISQGRFMFGYIFLLWSGNDQNTRYIAANSR